MTIKSLFDQYYEEAKQHKKIIWFIFAVFVVAFIMIIINWCYNLIFTYPVDQVSQTTNVTDKADLVNKYRTTSVQIVAIIVQIFGGIAILFGVYFAWENLTVAKDTLVSNQLNTKTNMEIALETLNSDQETAQKNIEIALATLDSNIKNTQKSLEVSQEGQITERFTRAVDQLGNPAMEIRLGGIYALERISNESEKDYWPIMEILTAYVRKNSPTEHKNTEVEGFDTERKVSLDIQAILTAIRRRKYSLDPVGFPFGLDLHGTYLKAVRLDEANLDSANFEEANLESAHLNEVSLKSAYLENAYLGHAYLQKANLKGAVLVFADLELALLMSANLEQAHLIQANLENTFLMRANLREANLQGANFREAKLEGANFREANLIQAKNLTIDQLSKVKTLYEAKLDEGLEAELRKKYPALFEEPV